MGPKGGVLGTGSPAALPHDSPHAFPFSEDSYAVTDVAVLLESAIRLPPRGVLFDPLQPAGSDVNRVVEFPYIRLDVQQRRTVEYIYILYVKNTTINAVQLDHGQANRIWPPGDASGKEPPWLRVQKRHDVEVEPQAAMEMIQQDDVGEAIKISQSTVEILMHLHGAFHTDRARRLNRHALQICEWCVDDSDRREFDHGLLHHRSF